jgi:hypothetical protein
LSIICSDGKPHLSSSNDPYLNLIGDHVRRMIIYFVFFGLINVLWCDFPFRKLSSSRRFPDPMPSTMQWHKNIELRAELIWKEVNLWHPPVKGALIWKEANSWNPPVQSALIWKEVNLWLRPVKECRI